MTKDIKITSDNVWLGNNELVIVCRNGYYFVRELYEDFSEVYQGSYKDCIRYCEERLIDYEESIIG